MSTLYNIIRIHKLITDVVNFWENEPNDIYTLDSLYIFITKIEFWILKKRNHRKIKRIL